MEFKYKIPAHIQGHLENVPETKLQAIMTVLFEMAINHRFLDYPKMHIEEQVDSILSMTKKMKNESSKDSAQIMEMLVNINSKLDNLTTIGASRQYENIEYEEEYLGIDLEDDGDDEEDEKESSKGNELTSLDDDFDWLEDIEK